MLDGDAYSTAKPDFNVSAEHAGADTDVQEFCVSWYGKRVGRFSINGGGIKWLGYDDESVKPLFVQREEDGCPQFLLNLDPSNPVFKLREEQDTKTYIKSGLRFLSNFLISPNAPFDSPSDVDHIEGSLDDFKDEEGVFSGLYRAPSPASLNGEFIAKVAECWENKYLPRFSGMEIKIPVCLCEDGNIVLAEENDKHFTHFVKFPIGEGKMAWGVNEWMCMELSEAAGLETAKHALLSLGEGYPPAYIVERFDIPSELEGKNNQYMIRDFCTLAQMSSSDLADGSMESMAKLVKQYSTDPEADIETYYKRVMLSWVLKDGDLHRKNVSMVSEFDPEKRELVGLRMSPTYDVTSEIFESDKEWKMRMKIQGKRNGFKPKALIQFGKNIGLSGERAEEILKETAKNVAVRAVEIAQNLPEVAKAQDPCAYAAKRIATEAIKSAEFLGIKDLPDWEKVEAPNMKEFNAMQTDFPNKLGLA